MAKADKPQTDSSVKAAEITSRRTLVGGIIAAGIVALATISVAVINYCGSATKPLPTTLYFTGRVFNDNTAGKVRGAKVSLEGESVPPLAYTDSEGIFSFPLSDPNKELRLRIEASSYEDFDLRVSPAKVQGIQEIRLTPKTETKSELSGTVVDRNESPLQGAQVTLDDFPGMQPVETSTDGMFTLRQIPKKPSERVRIRVLMKGYEPNPYTEDVVLGASPPKIKLTKK